MSSVLLMFEARSVVPSTLRWRPSRHISSGCEVKSEKLSTYPRALAVQNADNHVWRCLCLENFMSPLQCVGRGPDMMMRGPLVLREVRSSVRFLRRTSDCQTSFPPMWSTRVRRLGCFSRMMGSILDRSSTLAPLKQRVFFACPGRWRPCTMELPTIRVVVVESKGGVVDETELRGEGGAVDGSAWRSFCISRYSSCQGSESGSG